MDGDEGSIEKTTPRSLQVASFLGTWLVSAAVGSFLFRRYRRAAAWVIAELGIVVSCGVIARHSPHGIVGLAVALNLLRLTAAVDAVRLSRIGGRLVSMTRIVGAWAGTSVVYVLLASVLKVTCIEAFEVPTGAMLPTLFPGDHVIVDKRPGFTRRGDVIAFHYPLDPTVAYIKRVMAVGGDVVAVRGRAVVLNEEVLPAEHLPARSEPELACSCPNTPVDGDCDLSKEHVT